MLSKILNLFTSTKKNPKQPAVEKTPSKTMNNAKSIRKGELGEYKVTIQLDQMAKEYRHISDLLLPNPKAKSGYSQIDHILFTPYAIFIIETKNYSGEIKGGREDKHWTVNKRFKMLNPFYQNYGHIESIRSIIQVEKENVVSLVSFTRRCTFSVDPELRKIGSNDLIVYDIELTEFIQRKINRLREMNKEHRFTAEEIESMYESIKRENITNSKVRASHVEALKSGGTLTQKTDAVTEHKCAVCGKAVTDKIAKFCLANESRFQGRVYCYEHQKAH
ncbi:nuclease-related domain-containing protein [Brevibacillus sp. HD1.4A]|uniref:nuclease-related domain-containing protein n=1 Tax=Brevibacillus sp. HD1.4A TaxID=2738978 RepID=UPI00156B75D5|nr:nuclease-related domain-containing protein [Brevibacillus sp. HD1.4A]NRQ54526.1 NERD domain-containing protein [Brevibacillus sp. HD1.4A]